MAQFYGTYVVYCVFVEYCVYINRYRVPPVFVNFRVFWSILDLLGFFLNLNVGASSNFDECSRLGFDSDSNCLSLFFFES